MSNLRFLGHIFGAEPDQPNRLHADVRKVGVAGKLRQTLDSLLERIQHHREVQVQMGAWRVHYITYICTCLLDMDRV